MNKKIIYGLAIPLFVIVLVAATVIYYSATINVTADITEPFVTTTIPLSFSGFATEIMTKDITIENKATGSLDATITWIPRTPSLVVPNLMEITDGTTTYNLLEGSQTIPIQGVKTMTVSFSSLGANIGALNLAKKNVVFGQEVWDVLEEGEIGWQPQVTMEYSKIGDKFTAEVTNPIAGYELIYYADAEDRFANPEKAILVEDVEGDLPYATDENAVGGDYDYCVTNEYSTCHGAKIWYVPSTAINVDGSLNWGRASEFYFETDLITYTQSDTDSIGIITIERIA